MEVDRKIGTKYVINCTRVWLRFQHSIARTIDSAYIAANNTLHPECQRKASLSNIIAMNKHIKMLAVQEI